MKPFLYQDRSQLPHDLEQLKDIIVFQGGIIETLQKQVVQLLEKVTTLEQQVSNLKKAHFGQKSEKLKEASTLPQDLSAPLEKPLLSEKTPSRSKHTGRRPFPEHLERVRIEHDLKASEKVCPLCQGLMSKMEALETEQLDCIATRLIVKKHMRMKYACRCCYDYLKTAPLPAQPIEKGMAGSALLAQIIVDKFCDYLPCYRQERRFARAGVLISRSTLVEWMTACADLLKPLVDTLRDQDLLVSDHLFSDDTPMPTLAPGTGKIKTGRMWVYTQKPTEDHGGVTIYDYTSTREGKHPQEFLKTFKGYLQVDAYPGLDALFAANDSGKPTRTEVGCWDHARRKFVDIVKLNPLSIAQVPIAWIGTLYEVERRALRGNLTDAQRYSLRRHDSKPILKRMFRWLTNKKSQSLPKAPLGQAIGYALSHWKALNTYLQEGRLEIDNNRSERAIKPIVMGRKNHLFMGSDKGGKAAAIFYSLIETCRQNGINPEAYLADVLERISTHPNSQIKDLLPPYWKQSQQISVPKNQAA